MMDLYTLFIDNVFGSFWMAVVALVLINGLILVMGGVSGYSVGLFLGIFLLAMALGYGYNILTVPILIIVIVWSIFQMTKFIEER